MEYLYLVDLHRLFRINLLDIQKPKPDSHPVMECILNFEKLRVPIGMGAFTLNSKTYLLGGFFFRADIYTGDREIPSLYEFNFTVFTIHERGLGRSRIPPTFGAKTNPKVVQHGGKVYVLSTHTGFCWLPDLPSPTFEVYDPLRNRWESLPDPPPYECRGERSYFNRSRYMVRSFHALGNYIIMSHEVELWIFNINTKTWINGESIMSGFLQQGMGHPLHDEGAVAYFRYVMIAYGGCSQGLVAYFFDDPSCAIVRKMEVLTKLNSVFNPYQAYHGSVFYWGRGVMCFAYSDKSNVLGVLLFRVILNGSYSIFVECMNHRIYPATPLHLFDNLCPAFLTGEHLSKDMVNARVVCENIESFNVIPTDELAITFDAYRNELEKNVLPSPHLTRNEYQALHFERLYRFRNWNYDLEDDFEGFGLIPSDDVIIAEGIKLIPTNETKASEDDAAMRLDVALLDPHSADEAPCAETPFCENLIPEFYSTLSDRGVIILQAELEPMPAVFVLDSTEMERASLSGIDSCRFVPREHMDTLGALMFIPGASRMRPYLCDHSNYVPDHSKFELRNSLTGAVVKRKLIKCSSGLNLRFRFAPGLLIFAWTHAVWTIK